jgi:hypothetical protein
MRFTAIVVVVLSLIGAPAFAGLIQIEEADEAALCALRGASMIGSANDETAIFPRDYRCPDGEAELHGAPIEEDAKAFDMAANAATTNPTASINSTPAFVPAAD